MFGVKNKYFEFDKHSFLNLGGIVWQKGAWGRVADSGTTSAFSLVYKILIDSVEIVVCWHAESNRNISGVPTLGKEKFSPSPSQSTWGDPPFLLPLYSLLHYSLVARPKSSRQTVDTRHSGQCFPCRNRSVCWDALTWWNKTSQED